MLKINGKYIEMSYTVRARIEIGKLCGHSMQDFFKEISGDNEEKSTNLMIDAIEIMHNAFLRKKALEDGKEYEAESLDREFFLDLTAAEWDAVEKEIVAVIESDSKVNVETEAKKKDKAQN